jgi:hypothetical protein
MLLARSVTCALLAAALANAQSDEAWRRMLESKKVVQEYLNHRARAPFPTSRWKKPRRRRHR